MKNWVLPLIVFACLAVGFALGDAWRVRSDAGEAEGGAGDIKRARLTAISPPVAERAGDAGVLDLNLVAREMAGRSVDELLACGESVRGRFELLTYLESLGAEELRELVDRIADEGNPAHSYFGTLLGDVYGRWAGLEPEIAFAHAGDAERLWSRISAVGSVLEQVAKDDFGLAKELFEQIDDRRVRAAALQNICDGGALSAPEEAWLFLTNLKGVFNRENKYNLLIQNWAKHDLDGAKATALSLPPGASRDQALSGIIQSLAQSQPNEAVAWINGLDNESDRSRMASSMMAGMAHATPKIAAAWLDTQTDFNLRYNAISSLIRNWIGSDPEAALAYAETLADEEYDRAIGSMISGLSYSDPARAAALLGPEIDPQYHHSIYQIASNWVTSDPAAAAEWIGSLPASDERSGAEWNLIRNWVDDDPAAASAWVAARPADDGRDATVGILVQTMLRSDPEAALMWSTEIQDAKKGAELLSIAASRWIENDRATAEAALNGDQLPESARRALAEAISSE